MKIILTGIVSIPFLKKSRFTGSCGQMYFVLEKQIDDVKEDIINAVVWKGPYNYITTQEEKEYCHFSFDTIGLEAAEQWLNQRYQEKFRDLS